MPLVALMQERLQAAGIACLIRNQFLSAGAGELPPNETWPQLCVLNLGDEPSARKLIAEYLEPSGYEDLPDWICTHCGASNEAIFGFCWQCQHADNQERGQPPG